MRPHGQTVLTIVSSGGLAALLLAGIGGYVKLTNDVQARQTEAQVEHMIDLKTADKYAEIMRKLERIERYMEHQEQRQTLANTGR